MSEHVERGKVFWESLDTPELQRRIMEGQSQLRTYEAVAADYSRIIKDAQEAIAAMKTIVAERKEAGIS